MAETVTQYVKNYGMNKQLERIADAIIQGHAGNAASAENLDAIFSVMIDGTNTTKCFTQWWDLARAQDAASTDEAKSNRYHTLCRWFTLIGKAWGDKVYTLRGPRWDLNTTGVTSLTPMADLKGKTAAPCVTDATIINDFHWTDEDPMTWYVRFNGLSLKDGTMNILAVEGVDDGFDITGNTAPVYTGSIGLWKVRFTDDKYEYITWSTRQHGGMYPYAADVAPDGSHRPMYWAATFSGSQTSDGKLTSGSGYASDGLSRNSNTSALFLSANAGLTSARKWNAYEGTYSQVDQEHLLEMWQLRHFDLENSNILEGCTGYDRQYTVAMGEESVTSIVLTEAQGANLIPGSCVEIGSHPSGTNNDRGTAENQDIVTGANIIKIETVAISGTNYSRVYLDLPAAIDIPAGALVSTMPWTPGSTERLPGHRDGAVVSITGGTTPIRIAGIEAIEGGYSVGNDPLYQVDYDANRSPKSKYEAYICRDSEKLAGSITANYTKVADFQSENTSWQYVKHYDIRKDGLLIPRVLSGSATTHMKSAFSFLASSGVRACWAFGFLTNGGNAGVACVAGNVTPSGSYWTERPRLSGSGKKRGEWAA